MEQTIEETVIHHLEQVREMLEAGEQAGANNVLGQVIGLLQDYKEQVESGTLRNIAYADVLFRYFPSLVTPIVISTDDKIHNGSCIFVELEDKCIAVTNHHVIQCWRDFRNEGHSTVIQLGSFILQEDFNELILSDSDVLDLATILIPPPLKSELQQKGKQFFRYHPGRIAKEGDSVFAVGWPGVLRKDEHKERSSTSFLVAIQGVVESSSDRRMIVRISREDWVKRVGEREMDELTDFGGMSGGPIFLYADGVLHWVGVIFENLGQEGIWGEGFQCTHAHFLQSDGTIEQT